MINSTQEAMKTFEAVFMISFLCTIPQIMMLIYYVLAITKNNDVTGFGSIFFTAGLTMVSTFLSIFLPSYFGGKLSSETEQLKLTLHDILLWETDPIRSSDLKRFIRYIEARPFKFTVYKIIPMDWTLPVLILNIIVTYLIVAIQITHLF